DAQGQCVAGGACSGRHAQAGDGSVAYPVSDSLPGRADGQNLKEPAMSYPHRVTLAFTGASGAQYGLRLLQCLLAANAEVFVILSKAARVVIGTETDLRLPAGTGAAETALREYVGVETGRLVVCGLEQ